MNDSAINQDADNKRSDFRGTCTFNTCHLHLWLFTSQVKVDDTGLTPSALKQ